MQIVSTSGSAALAQAVSESLRLAPPAILETTVFPNGQIELRAPAAFDIGSDVALVHIFTGRVHDRLFELLLALDLLRTRVRRALTLILPYLPYSRSDRASVANGPVPAHLIASLLEMSGIGRLITVELHSPQLCAAFRCPVVNIQFAPILGRYLATAGLGDATIVAPDFGGAKRAQEVARLLGCRMAVLGKYRDNGNIKEGELLGAIGEGPVVLVDDEINSGATLLAAAAKLKDGGTTKLSLAVAHPLLTGDAAARMRPELIDRLIVTDSVGSHGLPPSAEILPLAPEIAAVLRQG